MKLDWRNLKPGQLAGLLNSTPLGEVTSEPRVRRNVVRAGLRVGDGRRVNFLGYVAWLLSNWTQAQDEPARPTGYEAMKAAARERNAKLSAAGRDIAPLPEVVDPERKARAESDFRFFFAVGCRVEEIFAEPVNPRGPGLRRCQEALELWGYAEEAAAMARIRTRKHWSRYVVDLLATMQDSTGRHRCLDRLRFLLYPSGLALDDVATIRKDETGVVWLGEGAGKADSRPLPAT